MGCHGEVDLCVTSAVCHISNGDSAGRKQVRGILHKTEDAAMHPHHGNPFSEDGSAEEQHEKPLLIASAGSSYAMDAPHRYAS